MCGSLAIQNVAMMTQRGACTTIPPLSLSAQPQYSSEWSSGEAPHLPPIIQATQAMLEEYNFPDVLRVRVSCMAATLQALTLNLAFKDQLICRLQKEPCALRDMSHKTYSADSFATVHLMMQLLQLYQTRWVRVGVMEVLRNILQANWDEKLAKLLDVA